MSHASFGTSSGSGAPSGPSSSRRDSRSARASARTGRDARPRFGFGLVGPRRDRHSVPLDQLDALALPVGDDGVVIGVDA
ncbi:hypothetical protein ACWGQ4_36500, partial [Streptomyces sp. NPDC055721]